MNTESTYVAPATQYVTVPLGICYKVTKGVMYYFNTGSRRWNKARWSINELQYQYDRGRAYKVDDKPHPWSNGYLI